MSDSITTSRAERLWRVQVTVLLVALVWLVADLLTASQDSSRLLRQLHTATFHPHRVPTGPVPPSPSSPSSSSLSSVPTPSTQE